MPPAATAPAPAHGAMGHGPCMVRLMDAGDDEGHALDRSAPDVGAPEGAGDRGESDEPRTLSEVLERARSAIGNDTQVSLGEVVDAIGTRSFAPLLVMAGIVMAAPVIGAIPGVPVIMGVVVILVSGQLILHRQQVWLPVVLRNRSLSRDKLHRALPWLQRPARALDRWSKPRLSWAVRHAGAYVIAATCMFIAAATPLMELVPMSANLAGAATVMFGIALLARDGLIALLAMAFSLATFGIVGYQLLA
jgi:hypothetical protein